MIQTLDKLIKKGNIHISDISEILCLTKDLQPIGHLCGERFEDENCLDVRDIFSLNYFLIGCEGHQEPFIYVISRKRPADKKEILLTPWSNEAVLNILTQTIYRKNQFKTLIQREPIVVYNSQRIDFNKLNELDFGYFTDEVYRNEEEVIEQAVAKNIPYKNLYLLEGSCPEKLRVRLSSELDVITAQ